MDDWIIVASSRWKLKKTVKAVNDILDGLKLEKHPGKTYVGRCERGVDFLGYRISTRMHKYGGRNCSDVSTQYSAAL